MALGKLDTPDVTENAEEVAELEAATADVFEISDWVARLEKLRKMKQDVEAREKETAEFIKGWLRDRGAEFGAVDGKLVVRRRTVTTRRIDTTALKAKEPEIAERFTKVTESDRLELIKP